MKGFFDLRSDRDLFAKLEADYARVMANPRDSFAAFDFCVTAWHLVEWHLAAKSAQDALCAKHPILRVCEHLAVGAKHFEPRNPKLTAVATTGKEAVLSPGSIFGGTWVTGPWGGHLFVELDGDARTTFGDTLTVPQLAEAVMGVWRQYFPVPAT